MKSVVVTGATSGIGLAVCGLLLENGYGVIGVGRSEENCALAQKQLVAKHPDAKLSFVCGDLMEQAEVRRVAAWIREYLQDHSEGRLYALINNAGCMRSWYTTTREGYEQQFALNHLAGFLLTHELLPELIRGQGRVLFTSSGSHKMMRMHWKDLMFQRHYRPLFAYKQSKLCNVLTAFALNERYAAAGVSAYAVDPGLVRTNIGSKNTGGLVHWVWERRKQKGIMPEESAKTFLMLCQAPTPPDGLYYKACKPARYNWRVNAKTADQLFSISGQLCGIAFGTASNGKGARI